MTPKPPPIDRFAPSPTGELHLGHAFSALLGWQTSRAEGGRFLLRIEDLDRGRCRPEFTAAILRDLAWLGLDWDGEVLHSSTRSAAHCAALDRLAALGLTYRCSCSRADIAEAASAPQEGSQPGPDGPVYPGTCRRRGPEPGRPTALRLDMAKAIDRLGGPGAVAAEGHWEVGVGPEGQQGWIALDPHWLVTAAGDVVLSRKDGSAAYHLGVVVDDAFQGVTRITRGQDLFPATPIHRLLQMLLGLPAPAYQHHRLIRDETGRRLAKRDRDRSLSSLREAGATPADIRRLVGL